MERSPPLFALGQRMRYELDFWRLLLTLKGRNMTDTLAQLAALTERCELCIGRGIDYLAGERGAGLPAPICVDCGGSGTVPLIPGLLVPCALCIEKEAEVWHFNNEPPPRNHCPSCKGRGYTVLSGAEAQAVLLEWGPQHGYEVTLVCRPEGCHAIFFALSKPFALSTPFRDGEADGKTPLDALASAVAQARGLKEGT